MICMKGDTGMCLKVRLRVFGVELHWPLSIFVIFALVPDGFALVLSRKRSLE